jgi:hypothetical protein
MMGIIQSGAPEPTPYIKTIKKDTTNFAVQRIKNGWLVIKQDDYETVYCKTIEEIGSAVASILGSERLK